MVKNEESIHITLNSIKDTQFNQISHKTCYCGR